MGNLILYFHSLGLLALLLLGCGNDEFHGRNTFTKKSAATKNSGDTNEKTTSNKPAGSESDLQNSCLLKGGRDSFPYVLEFDAPSQRLSIITTSTHDYLALSPTTIAQQVAIYDEDGGDPWIYTCAAQINVFTLAGDDEIYINSINGIEFSTIDSGDGDDIVTVTGGPQSGGVLQIFAGDGTDTINLGNRGGWGKIEVDGGN